MHVDVRLAGEAVDDGHMALLDGRLPSFAATDGEDTVLRAGNEFFRCDLDRCNPNARENGDQGNVPLVVEIEQLTFDGAGLTPDEQIDGDLPFPLRVAKQMAAGDDEGLFGFGFFIEVRVDNGS